MTVALGWVKISKTGCLVEHYSPRCACPNNFVSSMLEMDLVYPALLLEQKVYFEHWNNCSPTGSCILWLAQKRISKFPSRVSNTEFYIRGTDHLMSEFSDHFNRILMEKGSENSAQIWSDIPVEILLLQLWIESDFFNAVSNICSVSIWCSTK